MDHLIFSYIVFTLKKTRGFYRFSNIRNIPDEDFRHRIKLNGIITDVDNKTGIVKFFHRPIFLRIFNPEYHKIMTEEERVKLKNKSLKIKLYGESFKEAISIKDLIIFFRNTLASIIKRDRSLSRCLKLFVES